MQLYGYYYTHDGWCDSMKIIGHGRLSEMLHFFSPLFISI
jgi:hypothetical protein